MKRISLLTLLLLVVIVALTVSQLVMMSDLSEARAEIDDIRRKYGHIRVDDPGKAYAARIVVNEGYKDAYRVWLPAGTHYVLHLSDAKFAENDFTSAAAPTETISLRDWNEGADAVISCAIVWENNAPRVLVHTETEEMFDYVPPDWQGGSGPSEWSYLQGSDQAVYSTDQVIRFLRWRHTGTGRGVLLWLEPYASWQARQRATRSRPATAPAES